MSKPKSRLLLQESQTAAERTSHAVTESLNLEEATTGTESGVLEVEFITPGWGSSGYYSPTVVEAAAPLFAVGTHMYLDHPHADGSGTDERGNRSVRDLAAVISEAGHIDPTTGGIRGKVTPLAPYRDLLTDEAFAKNVGLSLRASATDIVEGSAEGRRGPIIEGLTDLRSVDFVTRAGRGGRVLQVLESARFVAEATADDRARQLSDAVRAAHSGDGVYAWVTDMDAERQVVWYVVSVSGPGPSRTWEQTYDVGDNDVDITLTGDPIEVSRITKYVPVTRPDSTIPTTEASKEDTMGKIQIEEAEHNGLVEKAGRVDSLSSENATLKQENTELKEAAAKRDRAARAGVLLAEGATTAGVTFTKLEERGLLADLPLKEGALDEEAFTKTVEEAAAEALKTGATSRVTGFGESASGAVEESSRPTANPWGRPLAESQKGA